MLSLRKRTRNILVFIFIATSLFLLGALTYTVGSERIVAFVGAENAYLLIFFIALLGGVSTFTAPSFFATLILFAAGGLNPLFLGVIAGVGLTLSDSLFFYFGVRGRMILRGKWLDRSSQLGQWFGEKPSWIPPLIVYLYTGFTPLPNDFLMVGAAFSCIHFRNIILPLLFGNMTLALIVATLAG